MQTVDVTYDEAESIARQIPVVLEKKILYESGCTLSQVVQNCQAASTLEVFKSLTTGQST